MGLLDEIEKRTGKGWSCLTNHDADTLWKLARLAEAIVSAHASGDLGSSEVFHNSMKEVRAILYPDPRDTEITRLRFALEAIMKADATAGSLQLMASNALTRRGA